MSKGPFPKLDELLQQGFIPEKFHQILMNFCIGYKKELEKHNLSLEKQQPILDTYLELIKEQIKNPYPFELFHKQILKPFNYYHFGIEFLRPLVDMSASSALGLNYAEEINELVKRGENVILFANHQIEADPQAISLLLEKTYPNLSREMIFVAGHRVVTDPLAVPFSMGRNLLCIYSKRYIDRPPEQKMQKQLHNKKTMEKMSALLKEGGKVIYVAPSGGRDRPNEKGNVEVDPFDPQSIEMFYLMAKKASHPTHFYTLALSTYDILPPPEIIQVELGETRSTKRGGIHLCFGKEIDMEQFSPSTHPDKHLRRELRADFIWQQVKHDYAKF
ncbi:MAG: 1-acyl-sn-glycerol-3-phosphate acyltransferase [Chlamydiota bacterium]